MTIVAASKSCVNMLTCTRKLNEKGTKLLKWNIRGKCASTLRRATTVANKLGPLLKSATIDDLDFVTQYSTEFDTKIYLVVDMYTTYSEKIPGDLKIFGYFKSRFKRRINVLRELQHFASDCFSRIIHIQPDDNTSQIMSQPVSDMKCRACSETSKNQNQVPVVKSRRTLTVDCLALLHLFV